jgi:hypothetical protein
MSFCSILFSCFPQRVDLHMVVEEKLLRGSTTGTATLEETLHSHPAKITWLLQRLASEHPILPTTASIRFECQQASVYRHVSIIFTKVVIFEPLSLFHNRTRSTLFQAPVLHIYPCVKYTRFLTVFVLNYLGENLPGVDVEGR